MSKKNRELRELDEDRPPARPSRRAAAAPRYAGEGYAIDGDVIVAPDGRSRKRRFVTGCAIGEIEAAAAPIWLKPLLAGRPTAANGNTRLAQLAAAPTQVTGMITESGKTADSAIVPERKRRGRPRKSLDSRAAASTKVEPSAPESDPGSILPEASNTDWDHVQSRLPHRQKLVLQAILAIYRSAPPSI